MFESYQINPTVAINVVSDELFQFRFPNANHISINHDHKLFEKIIRQSGNHSADQWLSLISRSGFAEDEVDRVFNTLAEIGVLVDGNRDISDLLDALLAHEDVSTNFARKEFKLPTFRRVSILGCGTIADTARGILEKSLNMPLADDGEFQLVVSDVEDLPSISALWRDTRAAKFGAALWSDGVSFRMGPLWVPGESGCFECFLDRTQASSQYPSEYEALRKSKPVGLAHPQFTGGQRGLLHYILERYFRLISDGFLNVIEPGTIENWNFFVGDRQVQRVLRNPYCSHCSTGAMSSRAVRDLI